MATTELKSCPNCGCKPKLHKTSRGRFYYECNGDCWLSTNKFWTVNEARADWNRIVLKEREGADE